MDAQNWSPFKPYFKRLEVSAKTLLLAEGQVSRTMFFIEKGCLQTWINMRSNEITTQFFFEGDSVTSIEGIRTTTALRRIACATSADRAKDSPTLHWVLSGHYCGFAQQDTNHTLERSFIYNCYRSDRGNFTTLHHSLKQSWR